MNHSRLASIWLCSTKIFDQRTFWRKIELLLLSIMNHAIDLYKPHIKHIKSNSCVVSFLLWFTCWTHCHWPARNISIIYHQILRLALRTHCLRMATINQYLWLILTVLNHMDHGSQLRLTTRTMVNWWLRMVNVVNYKLTINMLIIDVIIVIYHRWLLTIILIHNSRSWGIMKHHSSKSISDTILSHYLAIINRYNH